MIVQATRMKIPRTHGALFRLAPANGPLEEATLWQLLQVQRLRGWMLFSLHQVCTSRDLGLWHDRIVSIEIEGLPQSFYSVMNVERKLNLPDFPFNASKHRGRTVKITIRSRNCWR